MGYLYYDVSLVVGPRISGLVNIIRELSINWKFQIGGLLSSVLKNLKLT